MSQTSRPLMSGGEFDRDAAARTSEQTLDAAWSERDARTLPISRGKVAIWQGPAGLTLALQPVSGERSSDDIYLGRMGGSPIFARAHPVESTRRDSGFTWANPFEMGHELTPVETELFAVALALTAWHASMGFSPRDGQPTEIAQGGWVRRDTHGSEHFPRMDPVVIVLVEHRNRLLLGSNALWESGRFSLLAGYVEAGESAEQAVAREVFEESGMRVTNIRYVTSQPWPFPRSFMLGFRAELEHDCDPEALVPDVTEISELRWFTRDELRSPESHITLPGKLSIARWLLDLWVSENDE